MFPADFAWVRTITGKRIDWLPGEPWAKARINIREGCPGDLRIVKSRLRLSQSTLIKYLTSHGYSMYVADRVGRNVVGILLARHDDDRNLITHWWMSERKETPEYMSRMLVLMALEQPEVRTEIWVDRSDLAMESCVRACGWKLGGISEDQNLFVSEVREPVGKDQIEVDKVEKSEPEKTNASD